MSLLARWWRRFRAWFGRGADQIQQEAEAQTRQLGAEARLLGAEVRQLGAAFWEGIDGLPFVPARLQFSPVRTWYYGHGAFMGAAPALLADPRWRRILGFLMPDVFEAVRERLDDGAGPSVLMPMMENNPVLAAFGTSRAARASGDSEQPLHLDGMEWDLFVDTALVHAWERAGTPEQRSEVMDKVLDTALIAHAGAFDTVQENLGISQYFDVRRTPKTAFGGVEMDTWLDLFGRALALADSEDFNADVRRMASEPRSTSTEACMLHSFAEPWPVPKVVAEFTRVTGRPMLSVILDIKSLDSTPPFISGLVEHLNGFGVHVAAVGSFKREEIDGIGDAQQRLGEEVLPGPREVQFFHLVGDLQRACREERVREGQSLLFNGASLLDVETVGPGKHLYSAKLRVLGELDAWRRRLDLKLGFYVQEGDCEAAAAGVLSDIIDAWPQTFALGFAWGGLRDEAGLPPATHPRMGFGSQGLLVFLGEARLWELEGDGDRPE